MLGATPTTQTSTSKLLDFYGLYRLAAVATLLGLFLFQQNASVFGQRSPELFFHTTVSFGVFALIFLRYWHTIPTNGLKHALFASFLVDTVYLVIALHTSAAAGITALGLMCVITVATSTMVLGNPLALVIASLFVLGLLTDNLVSQSKNNLIGIDLSNSGWFSAFLMLTAIVVDRFARHLRLVELEAAKTSRESALAKQLNELILQQLKTGVVLLHGDEVIAFNREAQLIFKPLQTNDLPCQLPQKFHQQYMLWQANPEQPLPPLTTHHDHQQLQLQFKTVASGEERYTMLFLENAQKANQRAQQLKLASLGRLTASIAHEIRNPLAAIKHAAELIKETNTNTEEAILLAIIDQHTVRMNDIVENIQSLTRQQPFVPQAIDLSDFLMSFAKQFNEQQAGLIKVVIDTPSPTVTFEPSQLLQVLDNLCQNAARYTVRQDDSHGIVLHAQFVERLNRVALAVIDYGEPIAEQTAEHLFEPFFTTEHHGTGLGLYLSRELCLLNKASLEYRHGGRRRKSFSILFSTET